MEVLYLSKKETFLTVRLQNDNKGSILVLLIIVISLVMVLGASLLNIVFKTYDIKRFNTENKKSFYLSENGLNESYVIAYKLIGEAIDDSTEKAELYLAEYPLSVEESKNLFKNNYKQYITASIRNRINTNRNPNVEVKNTESLAFIENELKVFLRSIYVSDNAIEKITWVELIISVPEIGDVIDGVFDVEKYIEFANWNI